MNIENTSLDNEISIQRRLQLLLDSVNDYAIYLLTPEGNVNSWTSGAQRINGYLPDEIIGKHFSCFYSAEDQAAGLPEKELHIAFAKKKYEGDGWRVRKDGSKFWARVVIDVIYDRQGDVIGYAKITRDITERQNAAEALGHVRNTLFQSQKMEAVGKLTGGVAHDFNNLLAVIVSGLDLLSREVKSPGSTRVLASMKRAAERGATLTQQLLAFARQQPLKQDNYNLNKVINGFEAVLRRASHESIAFEMKLEPKLKTTFLDASQFETVLLNLVVNANDAMPNGGKFSIRTENIELDARNQIADLAPGSYVKVTVADTGSGMSADIAERAFEPFFTTKEAGTSSGMGLSHVYGFVAQTGGQVILNTEINKGTTIDLYLPALAETASDAALHSTSAALHQNMEKVLIVEDEPDVLEVAVELFRSMDYDVITANNGLAALDILKRTRDINVLFTDVVMPNGMSGIDLARFTQKLCPNVKVILASGYPRPALTAEHGNLDDFSFINKPYRFSELAKKLRTAT